MAIVGRFDIHADRVRCGRPRLDRVRFERAQLAAEVRLDLPRQTQHRGRVTAVGRDADLELAVARGNHLGQWSTHRGIGVQYQNAVLVVTEFEFVSRADHPIGGHAANLGPFENGAVGELRSGRRKGNLLARGDVWGAADDFERLTVVDLHPADGESIRIRVSRALADPTDSNLRKIGPRRGNLDVLEAAQREALDEFGVRRQIDKFRQPVERQSHQICSNTRRSPSKSSRMLGTP